MELIEYKNTKFSYENEKFNLNEILNILNHDQQEKNLFVNKNELISFLNPRKNEDREFINFIKNDFTKPMMDVFTFIEKNNLVISENEIFLELWYSLKDKKEILITPNLLEFMYNKKTTNSSNQTFKHNKKCFVEFLKEKNIDFEQIDYQNEKCKNYQYILDDVEISDKRTIHLKKYILLTIRNFKKVALIKSNIVRDYYLNLEEIFYAYNDYVHNYEKKIIKDQLKENNRINDNIQNFVDNIKMKNKNGYVYIATSKYYANLNMFKIGITDDLYKRLNSYNSNNSVDNKFYYCFVKKVYNFKKVELIINDLLEDFKDKKSKEMFIFNYNFLEEIINLVIEHISEPYKQLNHFIKKNLNNMYYFEPTIPEEIDIKRKKFVSKKLKNKINNFLDKFIEEDIESISRQDLINKLQINTVTKIAIWNYLKKILKWQNSSTQVLYKNKLFFITY